MAFAISPNKIGGLEVFTAELARQLKPRGWELTVCFENSPSSAVRDDLMQSRNLTLEP